MRFTYLFSVILFFVTAATGTQAEDRVLLDESFSGDTIPEQWKAGGRKKSFSVFEKALRGVASAGDHHGPSIGIPIQGHDLSLDFDFKFAKPGYFLCLIDGDSQFGGQAHLLRFAVTKKQVQLMQDRGDTASKREQKKARDQNGGKRIPPTKQQLADDSFYRIEPLAKHAISVIDGDWHHVKIVLRGNRVMASVDNQIFSGTGTVLDVKKTRLVFLVGQTADIRIDNVRLLNLEKRKQ